MKYLFEKRHIPWNKGKTNIYSKETKEKMSKSHLGTSSGAKANSNRSYYKFFYSGIMLERS